MSTPTTLGLRRSFGFGDRLGLATPGHIEAVRGSSFAPIFAQQSIREMARTDRNPTEVMRCAVEAIEGAGYTGAWGADGDHLQTPEDVAVVAAAGFVFFTIDPSQHVRCDADTMPVDRLEAAIREVGSTPGLVEERYLGKAVALDNGEVLRFDDATVLQRAEIKYGAALRHAAEITEVVRAETRGQAFELELSVDETDTPTTPHEHLFIGLELQRLNVRVVSLAPRFIGDFEKGVDYRGDLDVFAAHYATHAAIARHCGPYKLSIHSGSDKFSVYPIIGRLSGEHLHVKTAGTSYLEALRVVCRVEPELFGEIVTFSRGRFPTDRATYHISGTLDAVPANPAVDEAEQHYLDGDDGRQILHVTYGSVLTAGHASDGAPFKVKLLEVLHDHTDLHSELVARHLRRHIDLLERDDA